MAAVGYNVIVVACDMGTYQVVIREREKVV